MHIEYKTSSELTLRATSTSRLTSSDENNVKVIKPKRNKNCSVGYFLALAALIIVCSMPPMDSQSQHNVLAVLVSTYFMIAKPPNLSNTIIASLINWSR